ncbi:uncharacterized protein LOC131927727 [Physella acuta]|uniref:uncharacterized protein LOC131927727 n=1 Tax=Physella acuta TaxID=109671 RepID=UPI0027DE7DAD|nr:uncharacterized protein LOC131927727 [Physella acuta]
MEVYLRESLLQGSFKFQYFAMAFNMTNPHGRCVHMAYELGVFAHLIGQKTVDQKKLQDDLLRIRNLTFSMRVKKWSTVFQSYPSELPWYLMHPSKQTSSSCMTIVSNDQLQQRKAGIKSVSTTTSDPLHKPDRPRQSLLRMTSLLSCPQVILHADEFSTSGPDSNLILLRGRPGNVVPRNRYFEDLDGNVTVCLEDFLSVLTPDPAKRTTMENVLVSVLLPISMLCLLACFAVFFAFAELRSLSGKNNMLFIAALFCSQGALLLGYIVDDDSSLCVAFGVLNHYFCLCLFCALIVCSYHVYAIFATMHLSANTTKEGRALTLYCFFTGIAPLLVIALVILVHTTTHLPSVVLGYGGGAMCLLSKLTTLWVSLFLPLVICLVIAIVLFVLTCISLRHNIDLEINAADERHVHFYFRASLISFLTWMVGCVGIITSLPNIRIAFIIMQWVLGLYVFVTLVLTDRVTRLLTGCCCGSRRPPRGRTSFNLKMENRAECPARKPCIVATGFRKTEMAVGDCGDACGADAGGDVIAACDHRSHSVTMETVT